MTVLAFYSTPDPYAEDGQPYFQKEARQVRPGRRAPLQLVPDPEPDPGADWWELALCAEIDPELFFPEKGSQHPTVEAKSVCVVCPVLVQCRADALRTRQRFGIWGGLTEKDRRDVFRRHRRQLYARKATGRTLRAGARPYRERTRRSA
jgi:transcription factor WhiB